MQIIKAFWKKETVLCISFILAVVSAFFYRPSAEYLSYIDFRVLGILLALMIVMVGFQENGAFDQVGNYLLQKTNTVTQLCFVLVFFCFFFSMFITNDVALITFVPFTILILEKCRQEQLLIPVIVLQTIAANLGSMLTPIGNPQNLYLYNVSGLSVGAFVKIMLPYSMAAGLMLALITVVVAGKKKGDTPIQINMPEEERQVTNKGMNLLYTLLFLFALTAVGRIVPFYIVLAVVVMAVFLLDRKVLRKVDYCLIFTFINFFVFIGNMQKLEAVRNFLESIVQGREVESGILASQLVSNVPATLLLSGFTDQYEELLVGVNLGGLGTLIASMASLISYKLLAHAKNEIKGRYLLWFTIGNLGFLAVLGTLAFIIR